MNFEGKVKPITLGKVGEGERFLRKRNSVNKELIKSEQGVVS